ncbi:MAG: acetyl-CoA carboxylase biotin carboxyl carrier protein subunit [Bacteroidales bacterium]|nr:acetyl-CoA carboxylase biotin carboxyl carrier protein subunit [Bacteroidales bacterium]
MKKSKSKLQKYDKLIIDDTEYKTLLTKKFINRKKWVSSDPSLIVAFIPGVVRKIFVSEGDKVEEGDKIIILEAMKMKNIIKTEYSGIVKSINVSEGQSIPKGYVIAEIDIQINEKEKKE